MMELPHPDRVLVNRILAAVVAPMATEIDQSAVFFRMFLVAPCAAENMLMVPFEGIPVAVSTAEEAASVITIHGFASPHFLLLLHRRASDIACKNGVA